MATKLEHMEGEDFVDELLGGRRNFSGIELYNFDMRDCEGFKKMQKYLQINSYESDPVVITGSSFIRIKAPGLYLPYLQAKGADLRYADLSGATLMDADLSNTDLRYADLSGAMLLRADFWGANLSKADLRRARHLENTLFLGQATLLDTVVTRVEKAIIKEALKYSGLFDVRKR